MPKEDPHGNLGKCDDLSKKLRWHKEETQGLTLSPRLKNSGSITADCSFNLPGSGTKGLCMLPRLVLNSTGGTFNTKLRTPSQTEEIRRPKEREGERWKNCQLVEQSEHTYFSIKLAVLHGSWCPKTIITVTSKISDHRSLTHIIMKGLKYCENHQNVTETGSKHMLLENGINRLSQHRVATNLQFVKKQYQ
ncbi:uncharacterized protein LOC134760664 isoform X2 [Pongo abelii]|uniref:uncharacterized protein LOC134760664 isoform X2 n=1 Tax=Pongo abelii TaxID=9601 RepID=UPI00300769D5